MSLTKNKNFKEDSNMDKETLSNYGWIVICVLVLAVMLALATPFGKFISGAIENTTTALFQTSKAGLGSAGIDAGELVFGKQDGGAENPDTPDASASKITLLQSVISTNPDDPIWERTIIADATLKEGEKIKVEFYEIDANTKQPVSGSSYTTMMGNAFNKELTADQLPATFNNPNGGAFNVNVKMAIAMKISVIDADGNAVDFDMDNMPYFTKTPKAAVMNIYYNTSSTDAHLTESTSTTPSNKNLIPVGGVYIIDSPFTVLEGDGVSVEFPETPAKNDTYEYGDYTYTYNRNSYYGTEWSVKVKDPSKTSYGVILSEIAGKPVTNMNGTFMSCTSLTTAPTIPNSVISMESTFANCTSLTGTIEINTNPTSYYDCLKDTQITGITGSCSQATKDALLATK